MDKQKHRNFLRETAEKVSTWIIDKAVMKRFKEQAKAFYDDVENWDEKEQIPDPLDRLVLPYATVSDAHIGLLIGDDKPKNLSIPFDKEKSLQADYVLLTIIHDKRLINPRTPLISEDIWPKNEEWVELKYRELVNGYNCGSRDIQTNVDIALNRVKADIDKLPAETEQKKLSKKNSGGEAKMGQWGKREWIILICAISSVIVGVLMFLFGDNICGRFDGKPKSNKPSAKQIETR